MSGLTEPAAEAGSASSLDAPVATPAERAALQQARAAAQAAAAAAPDPAWGPVRALYEAELRQRGYQSDPAQLGFVEDAHGPPSGGWRSGCLGHRPGLLRRRALGGRGHRGIK